MISRRIPLQRQGGKPLFALISAFLVFGEIGEGGSVGTFCLCEGVDFRVTLKASPLSFFYVSRRRIETGESLR